mmetsp:Transcript_2601/g.5274  ORF Transcript_2601/g.5274 Transcript_2601/m.5274 type:complete len:262 (+) Transcript_2601:16-801(+)
MNRVIEMTRKCRIGPSHQAWSSVATFHDSQSVRHDDPEQPSSSYSKDDDKNNNDNNFLYSKDSTNPLYALVRMVTTLKQKRKSANEYYVRRVLREQIGFTEYDVDRMWNSPVERRVFQLSVRNNIQPVVSYLKSLDITASALVSILTEEPLILSKPVDDHIIPIVTWLFNVVGNQAPAVLLRCPKLMMQVTPDQLTRIQDAMQPREDLLRRYVWEHPREFGVVCRMSRQQQQECIPKILRAMHLKVGDSNHTHPSLEEILE